MNTFAATHTQRNIVKGELVLLLCAMIWGFSFVVQRDAAQDFPPFLLTSIRFFIGTLALLPFAWRHFRATTQHTSQRCIVTCGIVLGGALMLGNGLQQWGLAYTTVGKSGFLTSTYVVITPFFGYFIGYTIKSSHYTSCMVALVGMYLLTMTDTFALEFGDALTLLCAVFWAIHILAVAFYLKTIHPFVCAVLQCCCCAILSLIISVLTELPDWNTSLFTFWPNILFLGVVGTAIAYSLQLFGQRYALPVAAVLVMSLESVFAAISGVYILDEVLTSNMLIGAGLMFAANIIAQVASTRAK